jgi:amidase
MTINQETQGATATVEMPISDTKPALKETWEEVGARKRAALLASIPSEWLIPADLLPPASQDDVTTWPETSGWFTPEELAITDLSATELVGKLASGALKSVDVTKAFCKRASAAHQLV